MMFLAVLGYLLFCASGFLAVVKYFTLPDWCEYRERYQDGHDLSWCEVIAFAVLCLVPIANISANVFWLYVLRNRINRHPLIKWPKFKFPKFTLPKFTLPKFTLPKFTLPKCPIAIRGKSAVK